MKSRKKLTKAQEGTITRGTSYAAPLKDKNIYSGPLSERDTKLLDERFPGTAGGVTPSYIPSGKTKNGVEYSPKGVEATYRAMDENFLRSNNPSVQKWNANQNWDGDYPTTKNPNFKKGGSVIKGSQLRRQASSKGLRTSRKHK